MNGEIISTIDKTKKVQLLIFLVGAEGRDIIKTHTVSMIIITGILTYKIICLKIINRIENKIIVIARILFFFEMEPCCSQFFKAIPMTGCR